ncbi:MAG: OmpA family protein [Hamadaea sp.]|uniref:OmpA family protein n=1 Tax=Hamadaea sp. TaxID=2024425 RepID=UPI0017C08E1C|nr:OmpA family protein [Hamadaea sp.]NUR70865.1 OmpA family protein [Hamadaea sp.]NUT20880.1 OmpA family protein [Hamadaea sp.]
MSADARRLPVWVGLSVAVVGLLAIGLFQNTGNRHAMEDDLTGRSNQALQSAGITGTQVSFTGRDGAVTVVNASDVDKARQVVAGLDGVRVVDVTGPAAPTKKPSVTATVDGTQLAITGAVSQTAKAALESKAGTQSGLTVDPNVTEDGVAGLYAIVDALGATAKGVTIALSDGRITVSGQVGSTAVRDAVVAAAGQAVGGANVSDQLTVAPPTEVQQALISLPPITFEDNSAVLTAAGRAAVASAATILQANPAVIVRIEGHTDDTGTAAHNLELSKARAATVLNTLISLGVAKKRLSSNGFGESRPRVPNTSDHNRAINRRVEFIVQHQN